MSWKPALLILACVAIAAPVQALGQQIFAYPAKGQTLEQQNRDQQECAGWAVQQVGFPTAQPSPAKSASQGQPVAGGMVRGAAGGAALGAVGGAIAGNAGKGAAIGAGTGALFGGVRQHNRNKQQANKAQQASQPDNNAAYNRAYSACLQGRGYTVQ